MKKSLLATAIILALAATPTAFAKGKPTVELGNNLSAPTLFVPGPTGSPAAPSLRLPCQPTAVAPDANDPVCTLFPQYWCQKTLADWQASCMSGTGASVTALWGANLLGDAPLKAGRPIRVEMGLTESGGGSGTGFSITKLTPELDDRLATYGTDGIPVSYEYGVWDGGAWLNIVKCGEAACTTTEGAPIFDDYMSAEINSLGKVVYGFNWGTGGKASAAEPGYYKLTFTASDAVLLNSFPGAQPCVTGNCCFVIIQVTQSAGGGGSGRK